MADKNQALEAALQQIEKQFGKGAVMRLGEQAAVQEMDVIPTGSLALDMALGVGGKMCIRDSFRSMAFYASGQISRF